MRKLIIVNPIAGLSNRLRVLDSMYQYALGSNAHVVCLWFKTEDCNIAPCELFEPRELKKLIKIITLPVWASYFFNFLIKLLRLRIPNILTQFDHENSRKLLKEDIFKFAVITSYSRIFGDKNSSFTWLYPNERIKSLIEDMKSKRVVGIHIRRGDHKLSISNSPLKLFQVAIRKELKCYPSSFFFLATDDLKIRSILVDEFKEKIIYIKHQNINRNESEGIVNAFAELLSLSNCQKIFGSYWSSFSEIAAEIKNIPLTIICKTKAK